MDEITERIRVLETKLVSCLKHLLLSDSQSRFDLGESFIICTFLVLNMKILGFVSVYLLLKILNTFVEIP